MKLNPGDRVEMISTKSNVKLGEKGIVLKEPSLNAVFIKWDNKVSGIFECWVVSKDTVRKVDSYQLEFNF